MHLGSRQALEKPESHLAIALCGDSFASLVLSNLPRASITRWTRAYQFVNLYKIVDAYSSSLFLCPFRIVGGPRDPLKKRYSLTDSIMHLIEDGEIKKYLRNKSETLAERYDVIYKIFGSHGNSNPQQTPQQTELEKLLVET